MHNLYEQEEAKQYNPHATIGAIAAAPGKPPQSPIEEAMERFSYVQGVTAGLIDNLRDRLESILGAGPETAVANSLGQSSASRLHAELHARADTQVRLNDALDEILSRLTI